MLDYKYIQIVITFLRNSDILPFTSIFSPLFFISSISFIVLSYYVMLNNRNNSSLFYIKYTLTPNGSILNKIDSTKI